MKEPLIEFKDVVKRFDERTVLDRVNLRIYEGEVTTIIGKSGSGKSVLLKHIIGLLQPDSGEILLNGESVQKMGRRVRDERLGKIAYMFQNNALFDSLTVFDNIAMPLRYTMRLGRAEIEKRVMARIEQVELTEVPRHYPAELSGGMQKRVALARALVTDPEIILFDEPTTGQDPIRKNAILSMIADYQRRLKFTAVLISHDIPDVFFISNRVLVLYGGRIVFQDTPEAFDDFEHPFQDEFIHSLENLEQGLTGLYSKRHFKLRYQTDLNHRNPLDTYAVVVFTLRDLDAIIQRLGHTPAQELIRSFGVFISRHFNRVGGFSTRYGIDQFTTLLPHSDLAEAGRMLSAFIEELKSEGLEEISRKIRQRTGDDWECFNFSVFAGLAVGQPQVEIDSIVGVAEYKQTEIAQFSCQLKG